MEAAAARLAELSLGKERCLDERRSIRNIMHTFGLDQRGPVGYALASAASADKKEVGRWK